MRDTSRRWSSSRRSCLPGDHRQLARDTLVGRAEMVHNAEGIDDGGQRAAHLVAEH
jgi:hypothetical protein